MAVLASAVVSAQEWPQQRITAEAADFTASP
jgi:hypothetical protein